MVKFLADFHLVVLKSAGEEKEHLQEVSNGKTTNKPLFDVQLKMTQCETKYTYSTDRPD